MSFGAVFGLALGGLAGRCPKKDCLVFIWNCCCWGPVCGDSCGDVCVPFTQMGALTAAHFVDSSALCALVAARVAPIPILPRVLGMESARSGVGVTTLDDVQVCCCCCCCFLSVLYACRILVMESDFFMETMSSS